MNDDIIQVGVAHAGVISSLHQACFDNPWDSRAFGEILAMAGACALISRQGDDPRGFMIFRNAADEAEIITTGVIPQARRQGHGGALLTAAIEMAARRGALKMFLEVAHDNTGACALYQNHGFTMTGRRPAYYDHGAVKTDALIYSLEITAK